MFKINLFLPHRISTKNTKLIDLENEGQSHLKWMALKTIEWAISGSLWKCESNRRSICNFTRPWLYLPLPICINCRAFAWEGVYVYKIAFFFWLSPRTYHFLFEKRLIIDWRYFWRNIALSLILERSPDYPLTLKMIMAFSFNKLFPGIPLLPPKTQFIKIKFINQGLDLLDISNVFRDQITISKIPQYFEKLYLLLFVISTTTY